jgi:CBS domain-containing protein
MKVGEIMTPNVLSVTEDAPVREIARVLDRHRISGLPVCDAQGHMAVWSANTI